MKYENLKNIIGQFMKFGIVGASNVVVSLSVYYFLIYLGLHYIAANTIGYAVGIVNSFVWNRKFVFRNTDAIIAPLVKTFIAYGISYFANTACLWALVDICVVSDRTAPLIVVAIIVPMNFLMNKYWVYRSTL